MIGKTKPNLREKADHGGGRLAKLLSAPPPECSIGEAWILDEEKKKIVSSLEHATGPADLQLEQTLGDRIEDRGSQITFSGLEQHPSAGREEGVGSEKIAGAFSKKLKNW